MTSVNPLGCKIRLTLEIGQGKPRDLGAIEFLAPVEMVPQPSQGRCGPVDLEVRIDERAVEAEVIAGLEALLAELRTNATAVLSVVKS